MREPAEAGDDVAVARPARDTSFHVGAPIRLCALPQSAQEPETAVLLRDAFGMMKRMIEPDRRDRVQGPGRVPGRWHG